jgi:predicted XRE-type DNA-binding protein
VIPMNSHEEAVERARNVFWSSADRPTPAMPNTPEAWVAYLRESLSNQITDAIQGRMKRASITQSQMARLLGVSEGRVSQILTGSPNMTLQTIAQLLAAVEGDIEITVFDRDRAPGERSVSADIKDRPSVAGP